MPVRKVDAKRAELLSGAGRVWATFVAALDLRDCDVPKELARSQLAFYLNTFEAISWKYCVYFADPFTPVGSVQLLPRKRTTKHRANPPHVPVLPSYGVEVCTTLDFPSYSHASLLYDKIESREPGTSAWINVSGNKLGGYPRFIQSDLIAQLNRKRRRKPAERVSWRLIATLSCLPIELGDGGALYVFLGERDAEPKYLWHIEWQCH